jgi:hypothetical protein
MRYSAMRKKIAFSILCVMVFAIACNKDNSGTTPVTPADVHLRNGLLLYLPFEGNMADSSGNGNMTAAVGGATLTYDEHGNSASAFGATGNGERILVTNNGSIKFDTAFTISIECMVRSNSNRQAFVTMVNDLTGKGPSFILSASIPDLPNLDFGVPDSTTTCDKYVPTDGGLTDTAGFVLQPESWYNIVSVFHKGTIQIYINGTLISTKTGGSSVANICPDSKVIIGGWWQNDPISVNGKLDEIRLYNRVLNADEIAELSKNFKDN